jgi:hypothetical protein
MVMGSGKTFTACNIAYRLIKFAGAKRILFLVDRNNLGRQTPNEFQQFQAPYYAYKYAQKIVQAGFRSSVSMGSSTKRRSHPSKSGWSIGTHGARTAIGSRIPLCFGVNCVRRFRGVHWCDYVTGFLCLQPL